jgi:hypothetical protein
MGKEEEEEIGRKRTKDGRPQLRELGRLVFRQQGRNQRRMSIGRHTPLALVSRRETFKVI